MSSSGSSILREDNPVPDLSLHGEDQPRDPAEDGQTSATNEVSFVGSVPPGMEYAHKLHSKYSAADETFLWHNYDIPASVRLHFPGPDQQIFPEPWFGDICLHKRMLMADSRSPLQPIVRELLSYLRLSPFQVLPNGWRLLLSLNIYL